MRTDESWTLHLHLVPAEAHSGRILAAEGLKVGWDGAFRCPKRRPFRCPWGLPFHLPMHLDVDIQHLWHHLTKTLFQDQKISETIEVYRSSKSPI